MLAPPDATVSTPIESKPIRPSGTEHENTRPIFVVPVAIASEIVELPLYSSVSCGGVETHCVLIGTPSEFVFGEPVQVMLKDTAIAVLSSHRDRKSNNLSSRDGPP